MEQFARGQQYLHAARGRTILEVAVALAVLAVALTVFLIPPWGISRGPTPLIMQEGTHLRGIHQAMVIYAQGNGEWYPGFDASGNVVDISVEARFDILLQANFFTPDFIVSPFGSVVQTPIVEGRPSSITSQNYSYSMLSVREVGGRRNEWRDTLNSQAVVLSSMNTGQDGGQLVRSLRTQRQYGRDHFGDWHGAVAFGDGHTQHELTHILAETKYETGHKSPDEPWHYTNTDDNIFQAEGPNDAYLIHSGE